MMGCTKVHGNNLALVILSSSSVSLLWLLLILSDRVLRDTICGAIIAGLALWSDSQSLFHSHPMERGLVQERSFAIAVAIGVQAK